SIIIQIIPHNTVTQNFSKTTMFAASTILTKLELFANIHNGRNMYFTISIFIRPDYNKAPA
ncbi:MAG: hypothetical protein K2H95_00150, partial [Bacteroidales bacterium]|nr:hypothetical protein [Bacteroidales bacterium]